MRELRKKKCARDAANNEQPRSRVAPLA